MGLTVDVGVATFHGVAVGWGVGVDWRKALVDACSGLSVGVAADNVTKGVIFGAGISRLQLLSSKTCKITNARPKKRYLPIDLDSNTLT